MEGEAVPDLLPDRTRDSSTRWEKLLQYRSATRLVAVEGVRVVDDPAQVSDGDSRRGFWEAHDPTSGMGQGNDRGTQYRSGLYYVDADQRALAEASKAAVLSMPKACCVVYAWILPG